MNSYFWSQLKSDSRAKMFATFNESHSYIDTFDMPMTEKLLAIYAQGRNQW